MAQDNGVPTGIRIYSAADGQRLTAEVKHQPCGAGRVRRLHSPALPKRVERARALLLERQTAVRVTIFRPSPHPTAQRTGDTLACIG